MNDDRGINVAIIIGISEYKDTFNKLPASRNDAVMIEKIIQATEKFNKILTVYNNTESTPIKEVIPNFISDLQGKKINEFLLYYSGHGDFFNEDFRYILSDYSSEKKLQTTLGNNEVDGWIKSLDPNLTIKIIDSCYSGTLYVKDTDAIEKYFKETKKEFNLCYFMFSSNNDQKSYSDEEYSFFTKSFINSIRNHVGDDIRYRAIIDYISDDFESSQIQQPLFVSQAHNTEIFTPFNLGLKKLLIEKIVDKKPKKKQKISDGVEKKNLIDIVIAESESYADEEHVNKLIIDIGKRCETHVYEAEFNDLFSTNYSEIEYLMEMPKMGGIGRWLKKSKKKYFADPTYSSVPYDEEVPVSGALSSPFISYDTKTITKYRDEITGYEVSFHGPFSVISIDIEPKYPNLKYYNFKMTFIVSKTDIVIVHFFTDYIENNWKTKKINEDIKWFLLESPIKNVEDILNNIDNILNRISKKIIDEVREEQTKGKNEE